MKNLVLTMSVLASATLANPLVAAENGNRAVAPAPATVQAVAGFVDAQASRASVLAVRDHAGSATDLVLYPTADRNVVFVSFHTDATSGQGEHVGLVQTHDGRVTHYTDFSGSKPTHVATAASRDDAQSQARALLVNATPRSQPAATHAALRPDQVPASAQRQAADVLRATPDHASAREPRRVVALGKPVAHGDSQAMARALLTSSVGE